MMEQAPQVLEIRPLPGPPDASIRVPGSKSITNRALVCAALAGGETTLHGALFADDTEAMVGALTALGAEVAGDPATETLRVRGVGGSVEPSPGTVIDARKSGTTSRFLLPVAALAASPVSIDGHPQLRDRPFSDLVDALRLLGVAVEQPVGGGSLPLRVTGPIRSREVAVAADRSSQFLSGLMLAAPLVPGGLTIRLQGPPVSRPYLEMTEAVMTAFGALVTSGPDAVTVGGGGYRSPGRFRIEPDASSACYFWAAAALTGGRIRTEGVGTDSIQGDARFAWVLESMGAAVGSEPSATTVTGGPLKGVDVDLGDMSDTAPTLAVVAAMAEGPTVVRGVGFIRAKESDRVAAAVAELHRCGVEARELPDGFEVTPVRLPVGARIRTYDDHRMAMAFSVLGLAVPGMRIENPNCVDKTYPAFHQTLEELRAGADGPASGHGRPGTARGQGGVSCG